MRSLTGTLLAEQKRASREPVVTVAVWDREANVRRLGFSQLYGGAEASAPAAVTVTGNGTLVRVRFDGSSQNQYLISRVANPGAGSDFSQWSVWAGLGGALATAKARVALASVGSEVLGVYLAQDRRSIREKRSTDDGVNWLADNLLLTHTADVVALSLALKSDGTALLVFGDASGNVYTLKRSGGVWGSATLWSRSVASVQGLACVHSGDWGVVVTGTKAGTGQPVVNTVVYGDGVLYPVGTWSALSEVMVSDAAEVTYRWPAVVNPDGWRLWFVEEVSGTGALLGSYTPNSSSYLSGDWREPGVVLNLSVPYGVAVARSASAVWLVTASTVWQAAVEDTVVDLTGRVVSVRVVESPEGSGEAAVTVDVADGAVPSVQVGQQVRISLGYRTSAGAETSPLPYYWVVGVERTTTGELEVEAVDFWGLLQRWRARRQLVFSGQSVASIVQYILARAGLDWSNTGVSSGFQTVQPSFTLHAGESGAEALRRLLGMVPDVAYGQQGLVRLREPASGEASVYSYGSDHPVVRLRSVQVWGPTRVIVVGNGVRGEAVDWTLLGQVGRETVVLLRDSNLTTTQQAAERAAAELRKRGVLAGKSIMRVPVNCGQELYDVVTVTDSRVGLSNALRRVVGIQHWYSRGGRRGEYEQWLTLSEV